MDDYREPKSKELKELEHIALNTSLGTGFLEQFFPILKDRMELGFTDLLAEVRAIRGILRAILGALVVIAITLLVK